MYKQNKMSKTSFKVNESSEGEPIEKKIERILNNKEPITDGAPIIFTERKDGVQPAYDIRTDRFEVAVEAMDKVEGSYKARREDSLQKRKDALDELKNGKKDAKKEGEKPQNGGKKDGRAEPTQGTGNE